MYRLDAGPRELYTRFSDLGCRRPERSEGATTRVPRLTKSRSSQGHASKHLRLQCRRYQRITTHAALRMDGLLGSQIMELFAKEELEVDRIFAAASSQFEQAYNTSKAIAAVESRRRGSLTRK